MDHAGGICWLISPSAADTWQSDSHIYWTTANTVIELIEMCILQTSADWRLKAAVQMINIKYLISN